MAKRENVKKVGVFHDTPESAARHINLIWHDINSWWDSEAVKDAVNLFKNKYCNESTKLVNQVYLKLEDIIKNDEKR